MRNIVIAAFLMATISGCASVPMAPLEADQQAKLFQPVKGKSAIYIYRNEALGGAIKIPVAINDKTIGQTAPDTYFYLQTDPGQTKISCFGENIENFVLSTKPEQIYFIRQEMKMGMWAARCAVYEVPAAEGKEAINTCNMAQALNP